MPRFRPLHRLRPGQFRPNNSSKAPACLSLPPQTHLARPTPKFLHPAPNSNYHANRLKTFPQFPPTLNLNPPGRISKTPNLRHPRIPASALSPKPKNKPMYLSFPLNQPTTRTSLRKAMPLLQPSSRLPNRPHPPNLQLPPNPATQLCPQPTLQNPPRITRAKALNPPISKQALTRKTPRIHSRQPHPILRTSPNSPIPSSKHSKTRVTHLKNLRKKPRPKYRPTTSTTHPQPIHKTIKLNRRLAPQPPRRPKITARQRPNPTRLQPCATRFRTPS